MVPEQEAQKKTWKKHKADDADLADKKGFFFIILKYLNAFPLKQLGSNITNCSLPTAHLLLK